MPIIALLLAAAAVAADQLLKMLVVSRLKPVGDITVIPGFFHLTYVENPGAAFGILANQRWIFITLTFLICIAIVYAIFAYREHTFFSYCASILILAGGIGNIIDRLLHGYVVDYLHVLFFPFVFNFADCCVTVGTVLLIVHLLFFGEKRAKHAR